MSLLLTQVAHPWDFVATKNPQQNESNSESCFQLASHELNFSFFKVRRFFNLCQPYICTKNAHPSTRRHTHTHTQTGSRSESRDQFLKRLATAGKLKLTCEGQTCECSQVEICEGSRTVHKFSQVQQLRRVPLASQCLRNWPQDSSIRGTLGKYTCTNTIPSEKK